MVLRGPAGDTGREGPELETAGNRDGTLCVQ